MDTVYLSLLLAFALLAANAFFVAAEFGLVKARGFRIEALAAEDRFAAHLTVRIQGKLEAYLAACQLGITMASLGLGWVGEPTVAALLKPLLEPVSLSDAALHTTSFLVGFIIFSSLHIVVGEQVPKTLAIRKPEAISLIIAYPLHFFYIVLFPLNWALNNASRAILRLLRVAEAPHAEIYSNDEIRGLVDVSAEHGEMQESHAAFIHNIFRFDERAAERVMIPRVECHFLRLDALHEENLRVIQDTKHSRFPVIEDGAGNLVGMVLIKDVVDALLSGEPEPWRDIKRFCREPLVVPETLKVSRLFDTMRTTRAHMACVIDEYGAFVGLVTLEDLLEEIVGDIADETDEAVTDFEIIKEGDHWLAHGLASLADIERETGFSVEDAFHANTLSGLIMNRLERIAEIGDVVEEGDFRFTVEEVKNRRVEKLRIDRAQ
ncbi:MAG: hemolysin family protein [Proteobacteria bacterium]|nr:hemolysin family protein [Pseudomonadota bacterium]